MAAELATMKVSEEIDALEMMSINPVRFLVMPRIVALMIMLPTLSIYTVILGVFGGALISYFQLGSHLKTIIIEYMNRSGSKICMLAFSKALSLVL
jgi:phospholipid/cholesterol/gamma-HCH transport system permease protein